MQITIQNIDKPVAYPYLNRANFKDMEKRIDLTGKVFGRLTVISYAKSGYWNCQCLCGNTKMVLTNRLKVGKTKSCGCFSLESSRTRFVTHGEGDRKNTTKEYRTWGKLKGRCFNKKDHKYPMYGGRGITVCDRWLNSYENFLADMGRAPSKLHSIDRINNNGNYEPPNCRWATNAEQSNNRTSSRLITYNGETKTLAQWSSEKDIKPHILTYRLKRGWTVDRAFQEPIKHLS